jgi:hypothetical protein
MSIKMTRGEKISKAFQELYNKLLREGLKPNRALKEARKQLDIPNTY